MKFGQHLQFFWSVSFDNDFNTIFLLFYSALCACNYNLNAFFDYKQGQILLQNLESNKLQPSLLSDDSESELNQISM